MSDKPASIRIALVFAVRDMTRKARGKWNMQNNRIQPSQCLNCGKTLDAAMSAFGKHKPGPGDFTICIDCHHLMAFADDLTLRNLKDEEMLEVAGDKVMLRVMAALGAVDKRRKKRERKRRRYREEQSK